MPDPGAFANGALEGVRILDLSRVIAGPYLARICADLGAEVIKVEPPEGDQARLIAPKHDRGMSGYMTFANVGKRSIAVDLRRPEGAELALALAAASDAVIENFRPGVLDRSGLSWEAIHAANPRTVLVSINGFGRDSAWADRRAYAPIVQAVSGVLDEQSRFSGQPVAQISEARADTLAALHGAIALLAALRVAEATGEGQHVEVPLFDAMLSTYNQVVNQLLDPPDDQIMNPIYQAGPNGVIAAAGPVHHLWREIRGAYALDDPAPPDAGVREKAALRHTAIERWMAGEASREAVMEKLEAIGIACAPVQSIPEAVRSPLAEERGLLVEVDDRRGGTRPVVRPPARFSRTPNRVRGPAPRCGEHGEELLREVLGYPPERIQALREAGIITENPEASK